MPGYMYIMYEYFNQLKMYMYTNIILQLYKNIIWYGTYVYKWRFQLVENTQNLCGGSCIEDRNSIF